MNNQQNGGEVIIYTDGACSGNPGPGGWAALLQWKDQEKVLTGGETHTTNNRMEMTAIVKALQALNRPCHAKIHSDSALIINTFRQGWIKNWIKKGWKKADKKPVENRDLWQAMLTAMKGHKVTWVKVKGHSNDELNNRVDALAVEAAREFKVESRR